MPIPIINRLDTPTIKAPGFISLHMMRGALCAVKRERSTPRGVEMQECPLALPMWRKSVLDRCTRSEVKRNHQNKRRKRQKRLSALFFLWGERETTWELFGALLRAFWSAWHGLTCSPVRVRTTAADFFLSLGRLGLYTVALIALGGTMRPAHRAGPSRSPALTAIFVCLRG